MWLESINAISEMTLFNWNEVYELSAIEFLSYIKYYNYKTEKERRKLEDFRRKGRE